MEASENINTEPIKAGKRVYVDHGSEAWRILDAALLAAEVELEREQQWLEHDTAEQLPLFE